MNTETKHKETTTTHTEQKIARRRKNRNYTDTGPLSGIDASKFPGYRLYWAAEDPKNPMRMHELTVADDYDPVTSEELGYTNIDGSLKTGLVTRGSKDGKVLYLLKKKLEFYEEDTRQRRLEDEKTLHRIAHQTNGKIEGLEETSTLNVSKNK